MTTLTQTREIVMMNLRSIPDRLAPSLVIVIGIAGVVGVLVALLSMSRRIAAWSLQAGVHPVSVACRST